MAMNLQLTINPPTPKQRLVGEVVSSGVGSEVYVVPHFYDSLYTICVTYTFIKKRAKKFFRTTRYELPF